MCNAVEKCEVTNFYSCADSKNGTSTQKTTKPVNSLKTLIKKHKLIDIWRDINTNLRQYTRRRKNNISIASRIDYFLICTDIRSRIVSADIRPATISYTDHQAISLKINHKAESRGRGYFKLNSKILENEEYKDIIKQLISKYQNKLVTQNTDPRTLWDVFKVEVRDVTVKICKQISHEKNCELNKLEKTLQSLQLQQDTIKTKVTEENAK